MEFSEYVLVFFVSIFLVPVANATDFSSVTSAFDTAGITSGLLAVGVLMMAVVAVRWGIRRILRFAVGGHSGFSWNPYDDKDI